MVRDIRAVSKLNSNWQYDEKQEHKIENVT